MDGCNLLLLLLLQLVLLLLELPLLLELELLLKRDLVSLRLVRHLLLFHQIVDHGTRVGRWSLEYAHGPLYEVILLDSMIHRIFVAHPVPVGALR